ncbi:NADH-quinone oxidoreductase subunit L [Estrella lausannensis]|uniref:NADH-quinone oxidoreductase subunit L n=1 Tax=Estrella lausannensis TaxID=483423 RepID=A0A0H5DRU8_9BACT|nr:NADH-quinone oxidoreductase subunit L [Estrella lausannensis]CRX38953.1 NADH-quinone oxidoreductase subunit L [Estrella lausannensis]
MELIIWTALFLPLLGFISLLSTSFFIKRTAAAVVGCSTVGVSFALFSLLLFFYQTEDLTPFSVTLFSWIPIKGIDADFLLLIDPLSLLMTLIVTGVGFLIHVYSAGYMDHDDDYARFFAFLNFFIFSMLLLVLSGHLLLMFVGWEGVGLASYLLIGFWYSRPKAAKAATKAFIVNRVGDLGFLLGLLLTFQTFGTGVVLDICQSLPKTYSQGAPVIEAMTLLFFIGAIGKSAQVPLHVWLADAMEGPTPVSALIHAATMVTAGVFLLTRFHCVYLLAPNTLAIVGYVGIGTSLFAALSAIGQTDLKRVLAYSTVSQLGLMFLACSVGSFYAAMFHLTMHAFVKALLFLSAGNVVHMMHGVTEMDKMGGLSRQFNKTHILFFIGVLGLSGIAPFAAFFSKDLILEEEMKAGHAYLTAIGLLVSTLTAFYLTRAYCLTFKGKSNMDVREASEVKEAPAVMLIPVTVLAFLTITGGLLGFSLKKAPLLEIFLQESDVTLQDRVASTGFHFSSEMMISVFMGLVGFVLSWVMYTKYRDRFKGQIVLLKKAFYIDELSVIFIIAPLKALAFLISGVFDPKFFQGSIQLAADGVSGASHLLQRAASGQIRSYIAWMALGLFAMSWILFF